MVRRNLRDSRPWILGRFLHGRGNARRIGSGANVQRETAYVLGLTSTQTITRVILPQAVSTAIPGVVANVIFLFKESSVSPPLRSPT